MIDQLLTADAWQGRLLGTNTTIKAPLLVSWFATGNNVSIIGDTIRRVCPLRLETPLENSEGRGGFRHLDLLGWVGENRSSLLSDVLTILRGWHVAGRPDMKPVPWGSFSGWSGVVRNTIMWCGLKDPGDTRAELQQRADTGTNAMRAVLIGLEHLDPDRRGLTAGQIHDKVFEEPSAEGESWFQDLRAALDDLLSKKDSRHLGYRLRSFRRRVIGDRYLDSLEKAHGSARWVVLPASAFGRAHGQGPPTCGTGTGPVAGTGPGGSLFDEPAGLPD